jgi:hypothetical protein
MLMLTATRETQGQHPADFCDAIEGELVVVFTNCRVRAHLDRWLRCREACPGRFFGLNSHQAATTAKIRDVGFSQDDYALAIAGYVEYRGGSAPESAGCYIAERMLDYAARRPGTVIGITGRCLDVRAAPRASVAGIVAVAAHQMRLPYWRHHYSKRLRELDREDAAQPQPQA